MMKRFYFSAGASGWTFIVSLIDGKIVCSSKLRNSYKGQSRQSQDYSVWKRLWLSHKLCNFQKFLIIFRLIGLLRSSLQLIAQILDESWTYVELLGRGSSRIY